ncbi:MAG TPA: hypothetical protein VLJ42_10065 [Solirubrobacteraceae bacterium]|nr:hypothetical protein [Solirubrobacteraceae bacterium]
MTQHRAGLTRAQHVTVIDAVRAQTHRGHQAHDLPAHVRRSRPVAEINHPVDHSLDPKPLREHRREQHPGVRDHPLIIEEHPRHVRQTTHHVGDLLFRPAVARHDSFLPAQEVI